MDYFAVIRHDVTPLTIVTPCRYISRNKQLAVDYFAVIREASTDRGLSVRKRALKVCVCRGLHGCVGARCLICRLDLANMCPPSSHSPPPCMSSPLPPLPFPPPSLQVLWDCCVLCPGGFPYLDEAVMLILHHAGDSEESVRKLASGLCTQLWFSASSALGECG